MQDPARKNLTKNKRNLVVYSKSRMSEIGARSVFIEVILS